MKKKKAVKKKPGKLSKDKVIEALHEQLRKKDEEIKRLEAEKELLFKVSIKNAKKRLEEKSSE